MKIKNHIVLSAGKLNNDTKIKLFEFLTSHKINWRWMDDIKEKVNRATSPNNDFKKDCSNCIHDNVCESTAHLNNLACEEWINKQSFLKS